MTITHTQLKLSEIALMLGPCLYLAEHDFLGTSPIPFADLSGPEQQKWYRRAELSVLSGIGFIDGKARNRTVHRIVTDHEVWHDYSEDAARDIETMLSEVYEQYETQLMQAYQESQR